MTALHEDRTIGLLILSSEESQRFYPEMGTIYLSRLGELASAALRRFALPEKWEKDDIQHP